MDPKDILNKLRGSAKAGRLGAGLVAVGGAILIAGANSFYTVDGGHRAVIFSRFTGVRDVLYSEGLHFRIPWVQYPVIFDIRSRPRKIISPSGSKDLQTVNLGLRVLYRPDARFLPKVLAQLGTDYDDKVLPSIVNEVLKSSVAQFNASQLITQRQQVSMLIRKELTERAKDFYMIIDDVAITELAFSPEYTNAVESKQVAQQEAQRAVFLVEKAEQSRQQKIVEAEGEAASAKLIGKALQTNAGYLTLKKLEISKAIADMIAVSNNKSYLDANALMANVTGSEFAATLHDVKRS